MLIFYPSMTMMGMFESNQTHKKVLKINFETWLQYN